MKDSHKRGPSPFLPPHPLYEGMATALPDSLLISIYVHLCKYVCICMHTCMDV